MDKNTQIDGKKLRALRRQRKWTQRQLADKVGWSEPNVRRIESQSRVGIYDRFFAKLNQVLEVNDLQQLAAMLAPDEPAPRRKSALKGEVKAASSDQDTKREPKKLPS